MQEVRVCKLCTRIPNGEKAKSILSNTTFTWNYAVVCKCGRRTGWHSELTDAIKEWNDKNN